MAKLMPVASSKVLTPAGGEIKKRIEQLEHTQISLEREKGRLEREVADARASRDEAREMMHDLESAFGKPSSKIIDGNINIVYMSPEFLIRGDGLELANTLNEEEDELDFVGSGSTSTRN